MVEVNIGYAQGRVHEIGCTWVKGVLAKYPASAVNYETMPAKEVPAGKKHCSHC